VNPPKSIEIGYAAIGLCNPVSMELVDRALSVAGLEPGGRALDLGCGNATMAIHLAEAYGLEVEAIERSPAIFQIAMDRAVGRGAPGKLTLQNVDSRDYLTGSQPFDLLVAMGASQLSGDSTDPQTVIAGLSEHVRPSGFLFWAEVLWRRPPDPALAVMAVGQVIGKGHTENILAGEAAGLSCWYAGVSTQQEWDDFTWRMVAANQTWLDAHPLDPQAEPVRAHIGYLRDVYLTLGREALDFGFYLFRKPE